jgi:4-amino-4-deoxy-L-arabinose transferase-like glycosyltransferase
MAKTKKLLPVAILIMITGLYLLGAKGVPFHPDEATYIYMSGDLDILFHHPAELVYSPTPADAIRQNYRLLDAPLTRWLIGIGRNLAGISPAANDWNWGQTWQQNAQNGALPDSRLLLISRLSVAWLFGFTLFFSYKAGAILFGSRFAWLNVGLTALNALILMHTRRAMAESVLLFSVSWLIYVLSRKESNPILLAVPAALAFNAKFTSAGLVLVVLLAAWLYSKASSWKTHLRNVLLCAVFIVFITYILNPVAWKNPFQTALAALESRSTLAAQQVQAVSTVSPDLIMRTPAQRLAGWLAYLYISPPATADVANYLEETHASEERYFFNPLNNLFRGIIFGVISLAATLLGFALAAYRTWIINPKRMQFGILLLATLIVFLSLVFFIPLPFQRYVVMLVPFTNLWIVYLFVEITALLNKNREARASL